MSDDDECDDDDANRVGAGAEAPRRKPRGAEAQTGPHQDVHIHVCIGRRTQAETLGGGLPAAYCLLPKRELMIKQ